VKPAPITAVRADVPAPVPALVDKLMARHPDQRFQTPAELAALEPYAVSGPTPWAQTRPSSAVASDAQETPVDTLAPDSDVDLLPDSSDELLAVCEVTPLAARGRGTRSERGPQDRAPRQKARRRDARLVAGMIARGVVFALLAGAIVLALLGGGG
jgi:hypothetical protein